MPMLRLGRALALGVVVATLAASPVFAQDTSGSSSGKPSSRRRPAAAKSASSRTTRANLTKLSKQPAVVPEPAAVEPQHVHGHPAPNGNCQNCNTSGHPGTVQTHPVSGYKGGRPTLWHRLKFQWLNYWKPEMQETHWGYPEEFCEKPFGWYVYSAARTQVANGEAARMVLFEYDFVEDSHELNDRGLLQLSRIAYMLPRNFFPVIVEAAPNPDLASRRRDEVVRLLAAGNFPVPPERVVVSRPISAGIAGDQAEIIYGSVLGTVQNGGVTGDAALIGTQGSLQQAGAGAGTGGGGTP